MKLLSTICTLFESGDVNRAVDVFCSMNTYDKNVTCQELLRRKEYKYAELLIPVLIRDQDRLQHDGSWTSNQGNIELATTYSMMGKTKYGLSKYEEAYDNSKTSWELFTKVFTENHRLSEAEKNRMINYRQLYFNQYISRRNTTPAAE